MARRPGFSAVNPTNDTVQTLVSSPPAESSKLVSLVTFVNRDVGARLFRLYLVDPSSVEYTLYNNTAVASGATVWLPGVDTNTPIVVDSGWSLKAVSDDIAGAFPVDITTSWIEDTGDGASESPFRCAGVAAADSGAGTVWSTLLDEPAEGQIYSVRLISWSNDDDVQHGYYTAVYNISTSTRYWLGFALAQPAGTVLMMIRDGGLLVLKHGWKLQVCCFEAKNAADSHFTAHYLESRETDSGEL